MNQQGGGGGSSSGAARSAGGNRAARTAQTGAIYRPSMAGGRIPSHVSPPQLATAYQTTFTYGVSFFCKNPEMILFKKKKTKEC